MSTKGTFLMIVIERETKQELIPADTFEFEIQRNLNGFPEEFLYLAKNAFLKEIEIRIKYQPKTRALLEGVDWCIDGVQL